MLTDQLPPMQQRFVEEYLRDLNATAAARRAGYAHPVVQGPRLLGNVRVSAAIAAAKNQRAERMELTNDEVIAGLRTEASFSGRGAQHAARVRAWELLGKHKGMFPDKLALTNPDGTKEYSGGLTDAERLARLAALADVARARRDGQSVDGSEVDSGPVVATAARSAGGRDAEPS